MNDLPQNLQARRAVEDKLARLGAERARLEAEEGKNLQAIIDAIPFDGIARLIGKSRQTLYRWQRGGEILRNARDD
jgi:hypothetical protein